MSSIKSLLTSGADRAGAWTWIALLLRVAAGVIFILFGIDKFTNHAAEVNSFSNYGLPAPDLFVYLIGVLEVLGGALFVVGFATRISALALAGDMVGAIIVSGIAKGEQVSLTLAPTLLVICLFLIWSGAGRWSLDRRLI